MGHSRLRRVAAAVLLGLAALVPMPAFEAARQPRYLEALEHVAPDDSGAAGDDDSDR